MKWSVLSGCSALLAMACGGTHESASLERGVGVAGSVDWYGAVGGTGGRTGGDSVSWGGNGAIPAGGNGAISAGGSDPVPWGGNGTIPVGGNGAIPAGGSTSMSGGGSSVTPVGGTGATEAGGAEAVGGSGSVDPNSCSHDVARCFNAAAACYEYSPWSDCDQIVDVCSAMEMQCNTAKATMSIGGSYG